VSPASMDLTCPKCHAPMRMYERSGIHVDQCTECRGVFLDRGELERLLDAESAGFGTPAAPSYDRRTGRHDQDRYDGRHDKRRRGFLSDLFD